MKKRNPLYSPKLNTEAQSIMDEYGIKIELLKPKPRFKFAYDSSIVDDVYHIWIKEPETNEQKFNRLFNVEDAKIIE